MVVAQKKANRRLKGRPVIIDQLDAELGGKVVQAVMDDMERAAEARDAERKSEAGRSRAKKKRR